MRISICPVCKSLIKDSIHICKAVAVPGAQQVGASATNVVRGVEANHEQSHLKPTQSLNEDHRTIPPKESNQAAGNQPAPQSAVPQDTRFVKILSANLLDAGSLASNIVLDKNEKRLALIFNREFFIKRYVQNKNPLRKPVSQEDFKAIVYNHGGPVPSKILLVETKPDDSGNWVCVMWRMK